jgi:hypothetical protein
MLDLGDELADYGGEAKVDTATLSDLTKALATIPVSTGHTVPLADLQRQGFSTTPPPGYPFSDTSRWTVGGWQDLSMVTAARCNQCERYLPTIAAVLVDEPVYCDECADSRKRTDHAR